MNRGQVDGPVMEMFTLFPHESTHSCLVCPEEGVRGEADNPNFGDRTSYILPPGTIV